MDPLAYWVAFSRVHGVGPARLRALLDRFGSAEDAWQAPVSALQEAGIDRRTLANIVDARAQQDVGRELERLRDLHVSALTWEDPAYPPRLLEIADPPIVLYARGQLLPQDDWAIAMVGTRQATAYGKEAARQLAGDVARGGLTIVSGLARGIDTVAHRSALDVGGRTIAVLGSGVDIIYPWENLKLAEEIMAHGALVSEYPLGTAPDACNFPPRNRIISGLSRGVVVVEAGERSGALITANYAADQGRDVFAVPGSIFHHGSQGTNRLIRDGAHPLISANELLEILNLSLLVDQAEARTILPADETEALLLQHVSQEPVHVDDVRAATGLPIARVTSTLALMEMKGMVRQVGGMNYVRVREGDPVYTID